MKLNEVRKEEDLYYSGPFWVIANTFLDVLRGNFKIDGVKILSDYEGKYQQSIISKNQLSHSNIWKNDFRYKYGENLPYNYYPRGRVSIYKGIAFVHINSRFNTPKIIDEIIRYYNIEKLNIEIECNDIIEGSHYDFLLD